jgi:RNA polymerase sigma-70 factor, ECF subfamily
VAGIDVGLETRVLERVDAGDVSGAATLAIRGYGPQILGYLTAVLRSDDRAADAFALFSEHLWQGLGAFRRASSLRTWAYKLAVHAAVDVARDASRHRGDPLASSLASSLAEQVRTETAAFLRTENKTAVQKLREELTLDEQTLLILRIDRGLEWEEVADAVGVESATLRKRFERVKEKLRDLAKERGVGSK